MRPHTARSAWLVPLVLLLGTPAAPVFAGVQTPAARQASEHASDTAATRVYRQTCAACHGPDGAGRSESQVGFDVPFPDFTDCDFAAREPNEDWFAVVHEGGPVRGFDEMMPAMGDALSDVEIEQALEHVRGFCTDDDWPRGELNLPRPLVTEKAYPEDEAVVTITVAAEGPGSMMSEFVYESRIGARSQFEVSLPLGYRDTGAPDGWEAGAGDLALGFKHALYHSLESGSILSLGGEVVLPTGDDARGFGTGTTVLEPFVNFGQILPSGSFVHLQALGEFPLERDRTDEIAWRAVAGRTWTTGRFGRAWTPMVEVLAARELEGGADIEVDLVPQLQLTLNTRQHVMANLGVRVPLNDVAARDTEVLFYLLWDWFDGGVLEGW